jgi:hypothetical protein
VPLNRVPYRRIVVREQPFENVRSAPTTPKGRKISIIAAMAPMVMGLTMYLILDRWYLLLMTTMSPILLVLRNIGNRRGGKKKYAEERMKAMIRRKGPVARKSHGTIRLGGKPLNAIGHVRLRLRGGWRPVLRGWGHRRAGAALELVPDPRLHQEVLHGLRGLGPVPEPVDGPLLVDLDQGGV